MLPPGHVAGGYLVGRLAAVVSPQFANSEFFALSAFFGFFPDLDFFLAFLKSRKMIAQEDVNHREFPTHAPLLYLLVFGIWYLVFSETRMIAWAFLIGTWSHFIIDSVSAVGIPWLYPFDKKLYGVPLDSKIKVSERSFIKHWLGFLDQYTEVFSFKLEIVLIISAVLIYWFYT